MFPPAQHDAAVGATSSPWAGSHDFAGTDLQARYDQLVGQMQPTGCILPSPALSVCGSQPSTAVSISSAHLAILSFHGYTVFLLLFLTIVVQIQKYDSIHDKEGHSYAGRAILNPAESWREKSQGVVAIKK